MNKEVLWASLDRPVGRSNFVIGLWLSLGALAATSH